MGDQGRERNRAEDECGMQSFRLYRTIKTGEIGKEMKDNRIQKEGEINLRKDEICGKHSGRQKWNRGMSHITIRYKYETYGYRSGGLGYRPQTEKMKRSERKCDAKKNN